MHFSSPIKANNLLSSYLNKPAFLFTVDVEDWFQVENFKPIIPFDSWKKSELRVEKNTNKILDLLDEIAMGEKSRGNRVNNGTKQSTEPFHPAKQSNRSKHSANPGIVRATFFVLGWIARRLPRLVREIDKRGHEVASHGTNHRLCTSEKIDVLKKDLTGSKALLEDITGKPVWGYRSPSFSVNGEILKQIEDAGYHYDSSYNSFDSHDRYGKLNLNEETRQEIAYRMSNSFYELPISNLLMQPIASNPKPIVLPFGGGGYFRLIPYLLFRQGVRYILKKTGAYVFYMHPWEIDPDQPKVSRVPASLKFRHYVNLASTERKVRRMLHDFRDCRFVTCGEYLQAIASERL